MSRWIRCPPRGDRVRLLLNADQHTRLEGRVRDGVATLYAYDRNDVEGKDYSVVFQTSNLALASAVFDRLATWLGDPAPPALAFDVVAVAAELAAQ